MVTTEGEAKPIKEINHQDKLDGFIELAFPLFLSALPFFFTDFIAKISPKRIDSVNRMLFWTLFGWIGFFLVMYFSSDVLLSIFKNLKSRTGRRILCISFIVAFLFILTVALSGRINK